MSSKYPNDFDLFETKRNAESQADSNGDYVMAEDINEIQDAVSATQAVLGKKPQGKFLTVSDRIAQVEGVQVLRVPTVLIYLGELARINGATSTDTASKQLVKFDHIVIADKGTTTKSIIQKTKDIRGVKIYGYLDCSITTQTLSEIQILINQWRDLGVDGIYCDKIGYDSQVERARQNEILDSIHQYEMIAIVRATNSDDIFLDIFEATMNPSRAASHIEAGDIYHFDGFAVDASTTQKYLDTNTLFIKADKLIQQRALKGIKIFATATVDSSIPKPTAQVYFDYAHGMSILYSLDGFYASETGYSATSNTVPSYDLPSVIGQWYEKTPVVESSGSTYTRQASFGQVVLHTDTHAVDYIGASVPTSMLRPMPNTLDGLVLKDNSIEGSKIRSIDPDKLFSAINSANQNIDLARLGGLIDPSGGISLGLLRANVVEAVNASIGNATIGAARIGALDANKITTGTLDAGRISGSVVSAINLYAGTMQVGDATIGNAAIGALTADHIKAAVVEAINLNATNAVIGEAKISDLNASKITAGNISADRMRANIVQAINLYADGIVVGSATINSAVISELTANHIKASVVEAINARIDSATINSAHIGVLTSDHIKAGVIEAINARLDEAVIGSAHIGQLTADHIKGTVVEAINLYAGTAVIEGARIKSLQADQITAGNISADRMLSNVVGAINAYASNLTTGSAIITSAVVGAMTVDHIKASVVQAVNASIENATINAAKIGSLDVNNIKASVIQAVNASIESAVINQAKIGNLDAEKITAGIIHADRIKASVIAAVNASIENAVIDNARIGVLTAEHIKGAVVEAINLKATSAVIDAASIGVLKAENIQAEVIKAVNASIETAKIKSAAIDVLTADHIKAAVVEAINAKIGTAVIDSAVVGRLTANHISDVVIEAVNANIGEAVIGEAKISGLSASKIVSGDIDTARLKANAISAVNADLSSATINAAKIGALEVANLKASVVQAVNASIENATIDAAKIGALEVANLKAAVVQAVNASVENATINAAKIGVLTVDHIKGSVVEAINLKATTAVIESAKIADLDASKIKTGDLEAARMTTNAITAINADLTTATIDAAQIGSLKAENIQAEIIKAINASVENITIGTGKIGTLSVDNLKAVIINAINASVENITIGKAAIGDLHVDTMKANVVSAVNATLENVKISSAKIDDISANHIKASVINAINASVENIKIDTAKIGNLTADHIKGMVVEAINLQATDATIVAAKIGDIDANKITTGSIHADRMKANIIAAFNVSADYINGDKIMARSLDADKLKAGSITAVEVLAGSITGDRLQTGTITSDQISAGSITSGHITTGGLDAQQVTVYNGQTGEVLIGAGYIRVNGLDTGVVQSDNLAANGLFMTASSSYGFRRDNPPGEAIVGTGNEAPGGSQLWKIDLATDTLVDVIDIPGKKPAYMAIDTQTLPNGDKGKYGYVTVQGDDTVIQVDLQYGTINAVNTLATGKGPGRIKYYGDMMGDMKHFFMVNTDKNDVNAPDSFYILDAPPTSNDADGDGIKDFYVHHQFVTGNTPYDFVLDPSTMRIFVTVADQGDVLIIDTNFTPTYNWKIVGSIPMSEFGTDNYHGGLGGGFGLGYSNGGTSSKNYSMNHGGGHAGMAHVHGGYGAPAGDLRTYRPQGIDLATQKDLLFIADNTNGQLVVAYKTPLGAAVNPPPAHIHTISVDTEEPVFSIQDTSHAGMGMGGMVGDVPFNYGAGTVANQYVKMRIPVGSAPEFVKVAGGKVFVSVYGEDHLAVIDEAHMYHTMENGGHTHVDGMTVPVRYIQVGSKPLDIIVDPTGTNLYVSINGNSEVVRVNVATETVTKRFSTGANVMGLAITPDGKYLYTVNNGGSGSFSFVYPPGNYIGDAYVGLEGGIKFQGAQFWTPYRTDWQYDANGNVTSYAIVEFRINEPLLNEGGYTRIATAGNVRQMAYIEQDITNVTNFSDGSNISQAVGDTLSGNADLKTYSPKNPWIEDYGVRNIRIGSRNDAGVTSYITPDPSEYTIYYGSQPRIVFKTVQDIRHWVNADYTFTQNIWYKSHNASALIAIENSSSSNFNTYFEVEEFVPKFITVDNQQTTPFTISPIELPAETSGDYTGLEYSAVTNRAKGKPVTASAVPISGDLSLITDGLEVDSVAGDVTATPVTAPYVTLPGGLQYVTVDLQKAYMVNLITITHMIDIARRYHGTKTEVSEDGVIWTTVFDSATAGEYSEDAAYHSAHDHTHYVKRITFNAIPVRYVRDYANGWAEAGGPATGVENHWTDIKVYGDWEVEAEYYYNYALKLPQGSIATLGGSQSATWGTSKTSDISYVVDGTLESNLYFSAGTGKANITVDLGQVRKIDTIKVWHYYDDVRKYHETKTEISVDGTTWTTVFDSATSGEYYEMPGGNIIRLGGLTDVRYIRDWTNGAIVNDSLSDPDNRWVQVQALNGYKEDYQYRYAEGSDHAGQNLATNGRCFVSTDIPGAWLAMDLHIDFTSWWWMSYIRGPEFGLMAIDMPTVMGGSHVLPQDYTYVTKEAHRHIMNFPPSTAVKEDLDMYIKAGKHRAVLKQQSGRVSVDRIRFEDFQKYKTSKTVIPYNASKTFVRYKLIPEQSRAYVGRGNQSTEGAYDTVRVNPYTKLPDGSVPLKYRIRVKGELTPVGNISERGIAYVTSVIFETGRNSTHWRRSEASDLIPGNRVEPWDPLQPHTTGIQWFHLANGSVRGTKILPHAIMDYHVSPYAKIGEFKLNLNYPTHRHGMMMNDGTGKMVWFDNKNTLDLIMGWGTNGTSYMLTHDNHLHDDRYLRIGTGGSINGDLTITGNLVITGNVDGVDVSLLKSDYDTHVADANRHFTAAERTKLTGITDGATVTTSSTTNGNIKINTVETVVYTHPTGAGNNHLPVAGASGNFLKWSAAGTASWTNIDWSDLANRPNSSIIDIDDAVTKRHSQNTDTGTNAQYFYVANGTTTTSAMGYLLGSGTKPVHIRWSGTQLEIYKAWDTVGTAHTWGEVKASTFFKSDGTEVSYAGHKHAWADITSGAPTSTVANIDDAVTKRHSQNTDTGTTGTTFNVGSGTVTTSATALTFGTGGSVQARWDGSQFAFYSNFSTTTWANVYAGKFFKSDGTEVSYSGHTHAYNLLTSIPTTFNPPIATSSVLGGVKQGANVTIATDGTISIVAPYVHPTGTGSNHIPSGGSSSNALKWSSDGVAIWGNIGWSELTGRPTEFNPPVATSTILGGVKQGSNITIAADGTISAQNSYVHPTGDGNLHVPANGTTNAKKVLTASATAGTYTWSAYDWADLTGKPTTFTPPVATASILGGVKQGSNVTIDANGVISVATPYVHPTGTGNNHIPSGGVSGKSLKWIADGIATWGDVDWNELSGKPSTFTPSAHQHVVADVTDIATYYAKLSNANTFTNTITITKEGLGLKIQPVTKLKADPAIVLVHVADSAGADLFKVSSNGDIDVTGSLRVTGTTTTVGSTTVAGDYAIQGNLNVDGSATLGTGDATDILRIKSELRLINQLSEVQRFPVYGPGDIPAETDGTANVQDIVDDYGTFLSAVDRLPTVPTGAERWFKLLVRYSDDNASVTSTLGIVQQGTATSAVTLTTATDFDLPGVGKGLSAGARTWISAPFQSTHTGDTTFQVKRNTAGSTVQIKYIEVIVYDKYTS